MSVDPDAAPDAPGPRGRKVRPDHSEHSPWNWLLALPIVLPLLTPLYNRKTPEFLGFPTFYWMQLAFVLVGVASTVTVYRMTKRGE